MAGFDLSKLGLKKFEKPEEKKDVTGESVDAGSSESVPQPVAKAPTFKIGIKTVTAPVPPANPAPNNESTKAPDVFDLASKEVTPPVPTVIEAEDDEVVESSPEGMRAKLDRLDKMIIANSGVDQTSIDTARGYVQDIMVELKTHPEYSGVLADKDVHNIMTFVRATLNLTQKTFQSTAEKRTKAATKKAGTTKFDFSGLGDTSIEAKPVSKQAKQLSQASAAGLDAFANLNIDSIAAKIRK